MTGWKFALAYALVAALSAVAWADTPAVPAPGAPAVDPSFLLLPAYDLDFVQRPQELKIGDQVELKVIGLSPSPGLKLALPVGPGGDDAMSEQGWAFVQKEPQPAPSGAPPAELVVTAVPVKAGKIRLGALSVLDGEGKAIGRTNPLEVEVLSAIKADDPKPKEPVAPKPPFRLQFPWWLAVLAGLALAALIAGAIWFYLRWRARRGNSTMQKPAAPPKPEDEVALQAFEALERQGLLIKGRYKAYYFGVSDILKRYLGDRYGFDARESTSTEIVVALEGVLEGQRLAGDRILDSVESVFDRLDLVKFTDHVPGADDGGSVLEDARKLVAITRRAPAPIMAPPGGNDRAV